MKFHGKLSWLSLNLEVRPGERKHIWTYSIVICVRKGSRGTCQSSMNELHLRSCFLSSQLRWQWLARAPATTEDARTRDSDTTQIKILCTQESSALAGPGYCAFTGTGRRSDGGENTETTRIPDAIARPQLSTFTMKSDQIISKILCNLPINEKHRKLIFSIITTAFKVSAFSPFTLFVEKPLKIKIKKWELTPFPAFDTSNTRKVVLFLTVHVSEVKSLLSFVVNKASFWCAQPQPLRPDNM